MGSVSPILFVPKADANRLLLPTHPGYWAQEKLGYTNQPFHWEWYALELRSNRFALIAPREHAKSEVFSVVTTAHHAAYNPGSWQYLFADTESQAKLILERVMGTIAVTDPVLLDRLPKDETVDVILANYSRITVAGRGKAVRGAHPDRIIGDDVLSEESTGTSYQREKLERWWKGTVAPMAHPGTRRKIGWGRIRKKAPVIYYRPTTIGLVGTPFHQQDLLMQMRSNPIYEFRRYSALTLEQDRAPDGMWVDLDDPEVAA